KPSIKSPKARNYPPSTSINGSSIPPPDISAATETTFHQFCESCHITTLKAGLKSGPVKNCAGCHYTHVPHSKGTFILK
ncbi:hypothetical protein ACJROZ_14125, partial [Acetobacter indonesiensis]